MLFQTSIGGLSWPINKEMVPRYEGDGKHESHAQLIDTH